MTRAFELQPPDLSTWRQGNTGLEGVWRFESAKPGREVLVTALVHGNELCGAWALVEALTALHKSDKGGNGNKGAKPRAGALTLAFCNLAAFDRFDANDTDRSRFVDQDFNRLWGQMPWKAAVEQGAAATCEQRRVLELQAIVERADWLLDLHSMQSDGPALGLTGLMPHHAAHAAAWGAPSILVADAGHAAGTRMRDHGRFGQKENTDAVALLVECGWHGAESSRRVALDAVHRFLCASGCLHEDDLPQHWRAPQATTPPRLLQVTHAVTVREGRKPSFTQTWETGQTLPQSGTLIGHNGAEEVFTPYDDCVLVMPGLIHATPGATMVRLAKEVATLS